MFTRAKDSLNLAYCHLMAFSDLKKRKHKNFLEKHYASALKHWAKTPCSLLKNISRREIKKKKAFTNKLSRCRTNLRDFHINYISNCSIRSRLSAYQVFLSVTFKTLASSCSKMYREPMKWLRDKCQYRHKWGKFDPFYLLNKPSDLSF